MIGQLNDFHTLPTVEEKENEYIQESLDWLYVELKKLHYYGLEIDRPEETGEGSHVKIFDKETTHLIFEVYVAPGVDMYKIYSPTGVNVAIPFTDLITLLTFVEASGTLKSVFRRINK